MINLQMIERLDLILITIFEIAPSTQIFQRIFISVIIIFLLLRVIQLNKHLLILTKFFAYYRILLEIFYQHINFPYFIYYIQNIHFFVYTFARFTENFLDFFVVWPDFPAAEQSA